MITPEPTDPQGPMLFRTPVGDLSHQRLSLHGFKPFVPASEAEVNDFLATFCQQWAAHGHSGPLPDPASVRTAMDASDRDLLWLWDLAREERGSREADPEVAIAPVTSISNPFVIGQHGGPPLIVMSEGLWTLVMKVVLGVLTWADGPASHEDKALRFIRQACEEWRRNDPQRGPPWQLVSELATLDQDNTTFAVGLAHGFFTWAYLHELGHFRLNHLPVGVAVRASLRDDENDALPQAIVHGYAHQQELQADAFAYDAFLRLMPREQEVRRRLQFGVQIDHAPLIGFDVVNLALRLAGRTDDLSSPTHPAPLARGSTMAQACATRVTADGAHFYADWQERLMEAAKVLGVDPALTDGRVHRHGQPGHAA